LVLQVGPEGDLAAALQGLTAAEQQQQQQGADGVLRTCWRAALAHRVYRQRLLPPLKVRGMFSNLLWLLAAPEHTDLL
jgi:hypothetical protein